MSSENILRHAKRRCAELFEVATAAALGVSYRGSSRHAAVWETSGDQSVLIIAPHPDDEAMGCAGTAILHAQHGDHVCLAIATDGRRSRAITDPHQMAVVRQREARRAALLMRVRDFEWLGLHEGEYSILTLKTALGALIATHKPNLIYAPSRVDFHPEHLKVAHALAGALHETMSVLPSNAAVRVYQIQVPLTRQLSNVVADVSGLQSAWEAVLDTYVTQSGSVHCARRLRRYNARQHGIAGHAEVFWQMSAARYSTLHASLPQSWPQAFRGLRHSPVTDLLGFNIGRLERHALWREVSGPRASHAHV